MKLRSIFRILGFIILAISALAIIGYTMLISIPIFENPEVQMTHSDCDSDNKLEYSSELLAGNTVANPSIHLSISECNGEGKAKLICTVDSPHLSFDDIHVSWQDKNNLLVEYYEGLRFFTKEENVLIDRMDIVIQYESFRRLSKSEIKNSLLVLKPVTGNDVLSKIINEYLAEEINHLKTKVVDTLIIFETRYPGLVSVNGDSCNVIKLGDSKVFWSKGGRYFGREYYGECIQEDSITALAEIFAFIDTNFKEMQSNPILPVTYGATEKSGATEKRKRIRFSTRSVNHEPNYGISLILGETALQYRFSKSDLTDSLSIFYEDNQTSPVYQLFKMM